GGGANYRVGQHVGVDRAAPTSREQRLDKSADRAGPPREPAQPQVQEPLSPTKKASPYQHPNSAMRKMKLAAEEQGTRGGHAWSPGNTAAARATAAVAATPAVPKATVETGSQQHGNMKPEAKTRRQAADNWTKGPTSFSSNKDTAEDDGQNATGHGKSHSHAGTSRTSATTRVIASRGASAVVGGQDEEDSRLPEQQMSLNIARSTSGSASTAGASSSHRRQKEKQQRGPRGPAEGSSPKQAKDNDIPNHDDDPHMLQNPGSLTHHTPGQRCGRSFLCWKYPKCNHGRGCQKCHVCMFEEMEYRQKMLKECEKQRR
ncbi:unnamed protein product, partial [Amoebophrya sp. A120]